MIDAILTQRWDVIVIGTGIGGGTVGRRLAENGMSVLFIEKGPSGFRTEETALTDDVSDPVARSLRGFWPEKANVRIDDSDRQVYLPLGAGVGGSSVFYAATLERPEPHDLDDSETHPHPTGGWPVSFDEMLPYYHDAQKLYQIHGDADPLSPVPSPSLLAPPDITAGETATLAQMQSSGLHPYRLHTALRYVDGCHGCIGRKCPRNCKMDGRSAGVEPALATGRAALLDRCEVLWLNGTADRITDVTLLRDNKTFTLAADRIVLAAGALSSPRLLLNSTSEHWPDGCANRSGLVGRHLMFHLNEIFALWPRQNERFPEAAKSVGFRDFYHRNGQRFGMVQAMGLNASYGEVANYLRQRVSRSAARHVPGAQNAARLSAMVAAKILGNAKVYVGLLEDMPYPENRVLADDDHPGGIRFEYRISPELLDRRTQFRKLIRHQFRKQRSIFLSYEPEPNFGHSCGTLRMGHDPAKSVIDKNCRAHGIVNLWVADASFMPTSMGVNPSLTIAANAIRVADSISGNRRGASR